MNESLTDRVERCLGRMDTWLGLQFGPVFMYYTRKAGLELSQLEEIKDPSYSLLKTRYDVMIKQARDTQLI